MICEPEEESTDDKISQLKDEGGRSGCEEDKSVSTVCDLNKPETETQLLGIMEIWRRTTNGGKPMVKVLALY